MPIFRSVFFSIILLALMWLVKGYEYGFQSDLSIYGVYPNHLDGLTGIILAPFIHSSLEHLFSNSLPVLVLGSALLHGYPKGSIRVLTFVWLLSGTLVWIFAREAYHIGASGLTHGVFFFLFVASILRRDKRSIGLMMIAFFMYGSMILSIFPGDLDVSFEYHFFGAATGVVSALIWARVDPTEPEPEYDWAEEEPGENYWDVEKTDEGQVTQEQEDNGR